MRFGLELPCGGPGVTPAFLVRLAIEAERAGWDGVFLEDYLVYWGDDPPTFDPWVILAAAAGSTTRVWLGTTVSGLLARDPVKLAREAVTLDALAPGRVVLGVGLGDPNDRGAMLGVWPPTQGRRGDEMDRRLDLLLDLLRGESIAIPEGAPVHFRPAKTGVRVWIGGSAQAVSVIRRAVKADGIVPYKLTQMGTWSDFGSSEVADLAGRATPVRAGRGFDIAIGGRSRLDDEVAERQAIESAAAGGATWWMEAVPASTEMEMLRAVAAGPLRGTLKSPDR